MAKIKRIQHQMGRQKQDHFYRHEMGNLELLVNRVV
jgi:hypothetical protein